MTTIAMGTSEQLSFKVMSLMHEFRHEVFVKRLGWALRLVNGVESDEYDTPHAKYLVLSDDAERVTGCARLLPTTDSYMLPELFPQLLGNRAAPRDAAVWELSRFATSVRETGEGRILSLSQPTLDLLDLVFDFVRKHGVKRLILVTSVGIERLMLRAGLDAHRFAPPAIVDGSLCVALVIEVPERCAAAADDFTADREVQACA